MQLVKPEHSFESDHTINRLLKQVYQLLYEKFGPQHWWPAETPFEVMVGAILTQNTSWSNVEKAIHNLKKNKALSARVIQDLATEQLSQWLKPAGYFNVKTKRLKNFCRWYLEKGGFAKLQKGDTQALRQSLLSVNGVGPETADDILLYAFQRPIFVIDAYTRRLFKRIGVIRGDESYHELQHFIESHCQPDVKIYNEYHALIVRHAKTFCRTKPVCTLCPLSNSCRYQKARD